MAWRRGDREYLVMAIGRAAGFGTLESLGQPTGDVKRIFFVEAGRWESWRRCGRRLRPRDG